MMFNEQITGLVDQPVIIDPSKWHIIYWLKWKLIVKPKLMKQIDNEIAKIIDDINKPSLLSKRIK